MEAVSTWFGLVVIAVVTALQLGVVFAGIWWLITRELQHLRADATLQSMLATFGPAQAAGHQDPKQLLAWYPVAEAGRRLYPAAFASLDAAAGGRFPFSRDLVERAHARVSSDWLAWEAAHEEEYRLKAAAAEQAIAAATSDAAALARARLDRVQHEKIERYQQRYEEYVRTAKALQALLQ